MMELHAAWMLIVIMSLSTGIVARQCHDRCTVCEDGTCRECLYGWYGNNCDLKCQNCWHSLCHKRTGVCIQCSPGRYKPDCQTPCPHNCRRDQMDEVHCHREHGKCLDGCAAGWWGDTCNRTCCDNSQAGTCLQTSGRCIGDCENGWYGHRCDKKCPAGCLNNRCEWLSGKCTEGCKDLFYGNHCDKKCPTGCLNDRCEWQSGTCIEGCKIYLYGNRCTKECSMSCKETECDTHGRCVRGCIDGFRGIYCDKTCPFNCLTCRQESGKCTTCKTGWSGIRCNRRKNYSLQLYETPISGEDGLHSGCSRWTPWMFAIMLLLL